MQAREYELPRIDALYHYLLRREFEERGTRMRALNDHGDDSPEGELTDGILDQLAKFERVKTAERTRRGLDHKAKEGKVIRRPKAPIGFSYTEVGESLVVHEPEMQVVRRIFRMVGGEGQSLGEVERTLNREGVPSPTGGRWHRPSVRNLILSDLYRPISAAEVVPLVSGHVAASLDKEVVYGLWCWNTRRVRRWNERGLDGHIKKRVKNELRPREEWTMVPVSLEDSGLFRALVDAAREVMHGNLRRRSSATAGRRFWQLSGGIARCGVCGNGFSPNSAGRGRVYYRCFTRYNSGVQACTNNCHMAAPALEGAVWQGVYRLISDPDYLLLQLDLRLQEKRRQLRGDPDREARDLHERLQKLDRRRSGYLDLAADGDMGREELRLKLTEVDEQRSGVQKALNEVQGRQQNIEAMERGFERARQLLELESTRYLTAPLEDRRRLYTTLRLQAHADVDRTVRLTGVFSPDVDLRRLLQDPPDITTPRPEKKGIAVTLDSSHRCIS